MLALRALPPPRLRKDWFAVCSLWSVMYRPIQSMKRADIIDKSMYVGWRMAWCRQLLHPERASHDPRPVSPVHRQCSPPLLSNQRSTCHCFTWDSDVHISRGFCAGLIPLDRNLAGAALLHPPCCAAPLVNCFREDVACSGAGAAAALPHMDHAGHPWRRRRQPASHPTYPTVSQTPTRPAS